MLLQHPQEFHLFNKLVVSMEIHSGLASPLSPWGKCWGTINTFQFLLKSEEKMNIIQFGLYWSLYQHCHTIHGLIWFCREGTHEAKTHRGPWKSQRGPGLCWAAVRTEVHSYRSAPISLKFFRQKHRAQCGSPAIGKSELMSDCLLRHTLGY